MAKRKLQTRVRNMIQLAEAGKVTGFQLGEVMNKHPEVYKKAMKQLDKWEAKARPCNAQPKLKLVSKRRKKRLEQLEKKASEKANVLS